MNWIRAHKIWSTIIGIVILIAVVGAVSGNNKNEESKSRPQPSVSTPSPSPQAQQVPKYDLVGMNGAVRVYVIDPTDATEAKLTLIGKDLNNKFGSEILIRISIFTDRTEAKILADNPLAPADLEGAAGAAYDKAYVAQFNINKKTDLKEFFIFPNGENKEIKL